MFKDTIVDIYWDSGTAGARKIGQGVWSKCETIAVQLEKSNLLTVGNRTDTWVSGFGGEAFDITHIGVDDGTDFATSGYVTVAFDKVIVGSSINYQIDVMVGWSSEYCR